LFPVVVGYTVWAPSTDAWAISQVPLQSWVQNEHMPDWGETNVLRFLANVKPELNLGE
jgi:hypothetical protein